MRQKYYKIEPSLSPYFTNAKTDWHLHDCLDELANYPLSMGYFPFDESDTAEKHRISNAFENPRHVQNNITVALFYHRMLTELANTLKLTTMDYNSLKVTSAYRNKRVNTLVKGSPTSLHQYGLAIDIVGNISALEAISQRCQQLIAFANRQAPIHGLPHDSLWVYELIEYYPIDDKVRRLHIGFKYYKKP